MGAVGPRSAVCMDSSGNLLIHLLLDPSFTLQVAPYTLGPCHFRGVTLGCQVPCYLGGGLGTVCYQEAEPKGLVTAGVQSHDQSGHADGLSAGDGVDKAGLPSLAQSLLYGGTLTAVCCGQG